MTITAKNSDKIPSEEIFPDKISKELPTISVIIAVKNGAAYLAQALDIVMAQSYPATEIIVVDGHSTDNSVEIAHRYAPVRVLYQTTTGFAGAWNEGIAAAKGSYIAILDSDDLWAPTKLQLQIEYLEAHPTTQYTLSYARFFVEPGVVPPANFKADLLERAWAGYFPSGLLARKSLFEEVGLFDTRWTISSDVEWFKRVMDRKIEMAMLPETLLYKRVHEKNLSYKPPDPSSFSRELLKILKQSLDQNRSADQHT